jgi:predicted acylesterase/phospholipase RssA
MLWQADPRVRRAVLVALALVGLASALPGLPREDFFDADLPIGYGYEALQRRLQPQRRERPALALHLSGGSARAFSHLGVLRRLEEQGIYPDVVVTNSMGSIIGLLYAAGVPLDVIEDVLLTLDYADLFTLKVPTSGGIMDPRGLLAAAQALVGDPDLAELPIPVVVVCEDLNSMRRVLLCQGSFLTVLRAAIALPVVFEPVRLEDFLLIDGGITNLVPLEPFSNLADFTIAATAFYDRDLEADDPLTVLNMGINIAKSRTAVQDIKRYQPFLIRSDVEQFTYMGYRELPQIVARGYASCAARIEELQRQLLAAGIEVPAAAPADLASCRELYAARWAQVKRELRAGRALPLPGGFGGLQVHPVLLKRYRGVNRLEQANYLAGSYSYEAGVSGLRIGAAGDLQGKWAALASAHSSLWRRLDLGLDLFLFFSADGAQVLDPYLYGQFSAGLPLLVGERLIAGPFLRSELRQELPAGEPTVRLGSGLEARLVPSGSRQLAAGELGWFLESPAVQGLSGELLARTPLVGPLELFSRGLLRAAFSPNGGRGNGGITPTFNDFYRGVMPEGEVASFAVLNGELILAPACLSFSLWELFLLSKFELSAFCDLLWEDPTNGAAAPPPSLGLSLGGEVALIGLVPLWASIAAGYDLAAERPFLSLNLSSPY